MSDVSDLMDPPARPRPQHRPPRRTGRVVVVALFVLLVVALAVGAVVGARSVLSSFGSSSSPDYSGDGTGEVLVQVKDGDTAGDIALTLRDADVVKSAGAFREAAASDTRSRGVQPGFYRLHAQMSGAAALSLLLDPSSRASSRVTLPEGISLADALQRVATATEIPLADLQAAVAQPDALGLPAYADGEVEGFLFPATYDVQPGTSAVDVLKMMVARFDKAAQDLQLEERARALGRTPYEVLKTASLIEKETAFPPDRVKVARVVYNRLDKGQRLEFDSTVNYLRDEKKARLTVDDTKVESDYNTYQVKGLPPTPIGNPGQATIEAALTPAPGDWLYFVTVAKDGSSLFTSDYDAFINAKNKAKAEGIY